MRTFSTLTACLAGGNRAISKDATAPDELLRPLVPLIRRAC